MALASWLNDNEATEESLQMVAAADMHTAETEKRSYRLDSNITDAKRKLKTGLLSQAAIADTAKKVSPSCFISMILNEMHLLDQLSTLGWPPASNVERQ